jgi:hypothetical protein
MGYFKLERGWSENVAFDDEPLTQREAWIWLIEHAAWRDTVMSVGRERYQVKRGQLAASLRYLAACWQWSKDRVHRFLARLRDEQMVATADATHATIITICNYTKYQDREDVGATATATAPRQLRDSSATANATTGATAEVPANDCGTEVTYGDGYLFATATATPIAGCINENRDKEEEYKNKEGIEGTPIAQSAPEPTKGSPRGKQPKTRIDPAWQPTDEDRAFARGLGRDPDAERDAMVDWALDKQITSANWSARYRNWCRTSVEHAAKRAGGGGRVVHRQGPASEFAAASRAIARLQGRS